MSASVQLHSKNHRLALLISSGEHFQGTSLPSSNEPPHSGCSDEVGSGKEIDIASSGVKLSMAAAVALAGLPYHDRPNAPSGTAR